MKFDVRTEDPLVSVCLITYNHAPFIRTCLDSILMQQTNFPYEICIGEDESMDGTREICMEYAKTHPECIRLILRSRSEPGRQSYAAQGNYNYVETLKACRGKYVADCDGDDAWSDPLKLQKQVDVMEADPTFCLVHTDYTEVDARTGETLYPQRCRDLGLPHIVKQDRKAFMYDVLTSQYKISACTVLSRRSALMQVVESDPGMFMQFANGDTPMYCELVDLGAFAYIDEPLSIHRVLGESATHSVDPRRRLQFYNRNEDVKLYLAQKHDLPTEDILRQKICISNRLALVDGDLLEVSQLYQNYKRLFPYSEWMVYELSKVKPMRAIIRSMYMHRYKMRWSA